MEGFSPNDRSSWVNLDCHDTRFINGVNYFMDFVVKNYRNKLLMPCPCRVCKNGGKAKTYELVRYHIYKNRFDPTYLNWIFHGEERHDPNVESHGNSNLHEMNINDAFTTVVEEFGGEELDSFLGGLGVDNGEAPGIDDAESILSDKNFEEAMSALYPGCKNFTVLRFVIKLFRIKVTRGWSDISFTELLQLLKAALPVDNKVPKDTYRSEKLVKELGLTYEKIDACPNDCILYWGKKNELLQECPTCKVSRYKIATIEERKNRVRLPAKQLRYFPIGDRLKRMYGVGWVAKAMCWHSTNRLGDGELGHPVDSSSWKHIDRTYPSFSSEPRNVRLGLATDGFNPFGMQSTSYSSWPVMCVTYNLPPWLCMKPQFTMLALLIEGRRQPGNDIDIYLQPLVHELQSLWDKGVLVKDANRGDVFNMRAVLLWTIHDFPAFGNISGCRTKGRYACPPCGLNTSTVRLVHGRKNVYLGHRRFLPQLDPNRLDVRESTFNKEEELRSQPLRLSGEKVKELTQNLKVKWGKCKKRKRGGGDSEDEEDVDGEDVDSDSSFLKQSIFSKLLPYWEELPVPHNIDVMHTEKNVCEILIALMLDTKKTKDDLNARKDLKLLGIKKKYWVTDNNRKKRGVFCLTPAEKSLFFTTLRNMRVPVGFSSNWRIIVKEGSMELKGMKSHDYHILMQHLLPVLIQHAYKDRKEARAVILSFCTFFRALCSRRIDVDSLVILEMGMARTLCELEKMCPPSLFVIMMHLPIHLAYEARVLGPVFYRWMYVFERLMKQYKDYVTNKARPEGCIAERYLKEETMIYCGGYEGGGGLLQKLEECTESFEVTMPPGLLDEVDEVGPLGPSKRYLLEGVEWEQARKWILKSHPKYEMWEKEYNNFLEVCKRNTGRKSGQFKVPEKDEFMPWLRRQLDVQNPKDDELIEIARGPARFAITYEKYAVNGFLFVTKDYELTRRNQNSGVCTKCPTTFRSSAKDKNPIEASAEYYGVLRKIVQLEYPNTDYKPVLFKCDWVKLPNGVKVDNESKLLLVNLSNMLGSSQMNDEPFILTEHVSQVFYSKDPVNLDWHVVIEVPRKVYSDMDSTRVVSENIVVDESFARPIIPERMEDELIFNEENMVAAVEVINRRKRPRKK